MSATGNGGEGGAVVVPIKIEPDPSGLEALRAKLKEAESALDSIKAKGKAPTPIQIETSAAKAAVAGLKDEIVKLEKAQKDANAASLAAFKFQRANAAAADKEAAAGIKALFGTSVFEIGAGKIAAAFGKGAKETKAIEGALMSGGAALASGAAMAATAAAAIGAAGAGLVAAGVKFGVESTAQKQRNIDILDKLTRGQGEEAEAFSKSLAAQTGVAEDAAMERVKGLIQAKFGKEDTGAIFRASADIGAVKGEGKAELFLKTLEKVQFEGAATERSLKALESAGVDKGDLLAGLAKAGETTEQVEARLKAGRVAADEFARAAAAVVQKDIGGVAGKGLDAMLNRLKIGFGDLFDGMDEGVGALEGLGGIVEQALSGAEGAKLKEAISAAGNEVLKLAKNVTAADVKSFFSAAGDAATTMAAGIKAAAGAAADLWNITKQVSGRGSHTETIDTGDAEEREAFLRNKAFNDKIAAEQERAAAKAKAAAIASGAALADGVAAGIDANADKPAAAMDRAMGKTIAAGDKRALIKSPSRVMWDRGDYLDQGLGGGIEANAGKPEAAASRMMGRVVRAPAAAGPEGGYAASSGGAGASVQGGASGAVYHFSPNITVTGDGGSAASQKDQIDRYLLAAYPGFLSMLRQEARDAQEYRLPQGAP